jgi:hypothetical protein
MVSIIIPNWNGKKFLTECLTSLRVQTYRDLEVIFVDNASTDRSVEFVKASFPEIKIVQLERNRGFSGAANEGIRAAKGEFIALLNNDAIADPRWIEELVKGMSLSDQIGFCAPKILRLSNGIDVDTAGDNYTRYGVAIKRGKNDGKNIHSQRQFVFGACAAAALYRKSMLDEIGCFDEDLFCIYEDVDLSFRAQLAGFQCLYVPTAVVYHLVGGTAGTNNEFTLYYGQRNLESVFFKNMPLELLIQYLPLHLGYNFLAFIHHFFKKNGKIFLRSKIDALKHIGSTLEKRRTIQGKKRVSSLYLRTLFDKRSLLQHRVKAD